MLLADADHHRRRAVKDWLLRESSVNTTRLAETASPDVAFGLLKERGAGVAVFEASLKRQEDEFAAELGRDLAELPEPPRLILYAYHFPREEVVPGFGAAHFQLNAALAHAFVDLRRPDAPARLIEAVTHAGDHLLSFSTPKPRRSHRPCMPGS